MSGKKNRVTPESHGSLETIVTNIVREKFAAFEARTESIINDISNSYSSESLKFRIEALEQENAVMKQQLELLNVSSSSRSFNQIEFTERDSYKVESR